MAHPSSRDRRKPKEKVEKAVKATQKYNVQVDSNMDPSTSRMKLGAYSLPSLQTVQGEIQEEARRELRFPQASRVYTQMSLDSNVASAVSLIEATISDTNWSIEAPKDAPQEEKDRAELINYNLMIMDRPFQEYIGEALSYLIYGFHTPEKIYAKMETPLGEFIGIKDLRTISQESVNKWVFENTTGDLAGMVQNLSDLPNTSSFGNSRMGESEVDIPRKKFLLFRNNPKRNNPEGVSPLRGCYIEWKYLSLVEEFETIYATKGLGGILDLGIDVSFLSKASIDPGSAEATVVREMKNQAANFHNGDQAYVITPISYSDNGKPLFHTKILETTPPNTDDIIKRHSQRILQTFFADLLQLGATGGGSFALADSKQPLLMVGIQYHLNNIARTFNHDLIRQIYELNGWQWDARTSCRFVYDEIDEESLDELGKFVQRVFSVGAMDKTEDIDEWLRKRAFELPSKDVAGTEIREVEETSSRAGDGMAEGMPSGTGSATGGGDTSSGNTENA